MPATVQPIKQGGNIAPLPMQKPAPQRAETSQFDAFFNKLEDDLERRHKTAWEHDLRSWLALLLAYQGYVIMPRPSGLGFDLIQVQANDPIYPLNDLRYFIDDVVNQWVQSAPYLDVMAVANADDERIRATRVARALTDHYTRLHFTETFKQELAKAALLCGNYHIYQYFDPNAPGPKVKLPVLQESVTLGTQTWGCPGCGMSGIGQAAAGCPQCGEVELNRSERPGVSVTSVVGYKEVNTGDLVQRLVPAWQVRYDRAEVADKSPWLRCARDIQVEVLRALFPNRDIKPTAPSSEIENPDRIMRQAMSGVSTGSVYGAGDDDGHYAEFVEFWFEPEMYRTLVLDKPETLANGQELPAGTRPAEVFPKGLYRARLRGCPDTLLLREESHREHWSHQRLIIVPGRGVGDNVKDALEFYRQRNLLNSMRLVALRKAATPTLVINRKAIKDSQLMTKPGQVVGIENQDIPEGQTVGSMFSVIPAAPVTPDLVMYEQKLTGGMQLAIKSLTNAPQTNFAGGKRRTATEANIQEAKTQQARSGELALLADLYKDVAAKRLPLAQRYLSAERVLQITGKNGELETFTFRRADLAADSFVFWVRGTSYMPSNPLNRQANMQGALELLPEMMQAGIPRQQALRILADTFDVELPGLELSGYADWLRQTVNKLKAAAPQIAPIVEQLAARPVAQQDPLTGALVPLDPLVVAGQLLAQVVEIDPYEVGHLEKIDLVREKLTDDEGQRLDKLIRYALHAVIDRLKQAVMAGRMAVSEVMQAGLPAPNADDVPDEGSPRKTGSSEPRRQGEARRQAGSAQPVAEQPRTPVARRVQMQGSAA